ncbi:hypothetical protein BpHYR1_053784 [Brachionus plicatilis]|uniref:Uncharacterized protein n=1 Tax=Brachionus plicatilis TaxID=10195 RepID=A0A3M7PGQ2_BRAPC|nr:hypothetical protein BpHYR1_053784 [Brachionus plicatilis]
MIGEDLISQLEESGNDDVRKKETVFEKIKRKLAENMEQDDVPKTSKTKTKPKMTSRIKRHLDNLMDN